MGVLCKVSLCIAVWLANLEVSALGRTHLYLHRFYSLCQNVGVFLFALAALSEVNRRKEIMQRNAPQ